MKCPYKYNVVQYNATNNHYNEDRVLSEKVTHKLIELQTFGKCDEIECPCFNAETKRCERG